MSMKTKLPIKPLPLSDVLRDLAVLRTSGLAIPELFKIPVSTVTGNQEDPPSRLDTSVSLSYEYVKESRAAMRLYNSGKLDAQGADIENARAKYDGLLDGLDG